jgi:hypothetical protein
MAFPTEVEQLRSHISSAMKTMQDVFDSEGVVPVEDLLEAIDELEQTDRLLDTIEDEEVFNDADLDKIKSYFQDIKDAVDSVNYEMEFLSRTLEEL